MRIFKDLWQRDTFIILGCFVGFIATAFGSSHFPEFKFYSAVVNGIMSGLLVALYFKRVA